MYISYMRQTAHQTVSQLRKALLIIALSAVITGHASKVVVCRADEITITQTGDSK